MRASRILSLITVFAAAKAERFIRFKTEDGEELSGDAILPEGVFDVHQATQARVIQGSILGEFNVTDEVKNITSFLAPLHPSNVSTVRCVGFNYVDHNNQTGRPNPDFPIIFFKPFTALTGPDTPVNITKGYQNQTNFTSTMDYEAELVVVMKSDAFNITEDEVFDHVLGYAVGNDVSHRGWQIDRGGLPQPQFGMGKDADTWGPWGPAIVTTDLIPDPQNLTLFSKVNGVTKQNVSTADMIFGVKQLVSFFSMGITLKAGDIIFTGTPAGTQFGMANPVWLTDGDVVEVGLSSVGGFNNTYTHTG